MSERERERESDGKWRECFATSLKVCVPTAYMPLRSLSLERFAIDLSATHCLKIYTPSLTHIRSHTLTIKCMKKHPIFYSVSLSLSLSFPIGCTCTHTLTHTLTHARTHKHTQKNIHPAPHYNFSVCAKWKQ